MIPDRRRAPARRDSGVTSRRRRLSCRLFTVSMVAFGVLVWWLSTRYGLDRAGNVAGVASLVIGVCGLVWSVTSTVQQATSDEKRLAPVEDRAIDGLDRIVAGEDLSITVLRALNEDLGAVHQQYLTMFTELALLVERVYPDSEEFRAAVDKLRLEHVNGRANRGRIHGIANELRNSSLPESARVFVQDVVDYFPAGDLRDLPGTLETEGTKVVRDILTMHENKDFTELADVLHRTVTAQQTQWQKVCSSYGRLIAGLVSSGSRTGGSPEVTNQKRPYHPHDEN
jgi:hypothetical protein